MTNQLVQSPCSWNWAACWRAVTACQAEIDLRQIRLLRHSRVPCPPESNAVGGSARYPLDMHLQFAGFLSRSDDDNAEDENKEADDDNQR